MQYHYNTKDNMVIFDGGSWSPLTMPEPPHRLEYTEGYLMYFAWKRSNSYMRKNAGFLNEYKLTNNLIGKSYSSMFRVSIAYDSLEERRDFVYHLFSDALEQRRVTVQLIPATCIWNVATDMIRSYTPDFVNGIVV